MKKNSEMEWISGDEIAGAILAAEERDIDAILDDLKYAQVRNKQYLRMSIEIEELRRQDIELNSFIEDRYDIAPMEGEAPPILIGKRWTHGPQNENLVVDGYYRIAAALAAGKREIMAYVPESSPMISYHCSSLLKSQFVN